MNIYTIIFGLIALLILLWRMRAGFSKGFSHELSNAVSIAIAVWVGSVLIKSYQDFIAMHIGLAICNVLMLGAVFTIYRILKILLSALKLFSVLPVIKGIDKLFGAVLGLVEGFSIVVLLLILLKNWAVSGSFI